MNEQEYLSEIMKYLLKGYTKNPKGVLKLCVIGLVNLQMDAEKGRLPPDGVTTLKEIYEEFPGLEGLVTKFTQG